MADSHVTEAFGSGCRLEEAFIELKMLVQSYVDISEETTPFLFTLEKGVERFESALQMHQAVLHAHCWQVELEPDGVAHLTG